MKVRLQFHSDSIYGEKTEIVECHHFSPYHSRLNFFYTSVDRSDRSIDLDQIAEWAVVPEFQLETKTENYLNEHGNVVNLYRAMSVNARTGQCFFDALSTMDQYLLVQAGSKDRLYGDNYGLDSLAILQAIEFLEDAKKNYPENHPLRELAKKG